MTPRLHLDWPLIALFMLGPVQWITLVDIGLALKPVHLPFFYCAGIGFLLAWRGQARVDRAIWQGAAPFAVAYLAYLAVLYLASFQAPATGRALSLVIKLAVQAGAGFGLFLYLSHLSTRKILDSMLMASLLAALMFVAIAWVTLAGRGISLPQLLVQAISTGNAALLQFKLFLTLFNAHDWTIGGSRTPASLRQVSLAFFYITGLFAILRLTHPDCTRRDRWIALTGLTLGLLIILASLSRSLILMVALGGFVVCLGLMRRRADAVLYLLVALGLGAGAFYLLRDPTGLLTIVEARFGGLGQDGRVTQYAQSLATIAERPVLGHGTGHMDEFRAGRQNMVHNLFLAAWVQAGLAGLISSLAFTGALVLAFLGRGFHFRATPHGLALVALLILPLIRSQVGGQGGNYTLPEFLALILALNLLYRPDLIHMPAPNVSRAKHSRPAFLQKTPTRETAPES